MNTAPTAPPTATPPGPSTVPPGAPPGESTPEAGLSERLGLGTWSPSFRDVILGLGFLLVVAGSVANIAHYLEGHAATEAPTAVAAPSEPDVAAGPSATVVAATAVPSSVLAPATEASNVEPVADGELSTYVVVPGDVLYEIAVRHGTTPQALADLNELTDPNRIEVGQVLTVPAPATES